ncbi:M20/M25/M40 family metallo-hydrolase [Patescibacteria group bacterium]|nr:M20/M25/M40 family metallo-hydrolase [Patescibacteria group bacterium]
MANKVERLRASSEAWDGILPVMKDYIRIPNKSPAFDKDWKVNGHMDRATALFAGWAEEQKQFIPGLSVAVQEIEGRTPLIYMEVPGTAPGNLLMYGHLDKQPEFEGWTNGRTPWEPQLEGSKLYGRGGADDGYAMFAALEALKQVVRDGKPYARISIIIEASEESGSPDLPAHLEQLAGRIGSPDAVICLDSGAGDYERFWETTSLRGIVIGTLKVDTLAEGMHSGSGSGGVADNFMLATDLITRIQNPKTGEIIPELHREIPQSRIDQARALAAHFRDELSKELPLLDGVQTLNPDLVELILNRTWRPALTVTGSNLPALQNAGNVLRPTTALKLSMRIPPGMDDKAAAAVMKSKLEEDPPFGSRVEFEVNSSAVGWSAPETAPWLRGAIDDASEQYFGNSAMAMGEGGTIPFMAMLGEQFPEAQFVITGVLGPGSNAHGPNEFLELDYVKRLTPAVAGIIEAHAAEQIQRNTIEF